MNRSFVYKAKEGRYVRIGYKELILHEYMENTKSVNTYFINYILSVVRLTVYKGRQVLDYDRKQINIKKNCLCLQCTNS